MRSLGLICGACVVGIVGCQPATGVIPYEGEVEVEPRGLYIPVPYEHARVSGSVDTLVGRRASGPLFVGPGDPPLPIYLNRFGGTYSPGPDDSRNNTSIIPNGTSQVDLYGGNDAQWQEVVACLTEQFAPFNAVIVEQEPAGGQYIESVIGGYPQQVGLGGGVGGVAPIDTFNCGVIANAIVFTFSNVFGDDPRTSCEVAAQEIAHAISLDHEYYCPDPMTYLSGCGDKSFRDYPADCGEFSARQCECNRPTQNSVEVITDKLGPNSGIPPPPPVNDPNPPNIMITSPSNGAVLQENSTITVTAVATDDVGIAATDLFWAFSGNTFPCPGTSGGGAVTCTRTGDTSTWSIRVGQGERTFYARARDVGGNVVQTNDLTIQLGTAVPPPDDTEAPTITLVRPLNNAVLTANSTIEVEATVTDNLGLAAVEVNWIFAQDTFPCPFQGQDVSCTQNGDQFVWGIRVGVGTRRFTVRATDLAGNVTETPEINITLQTEIPPPDPNMDTVGEENDNPGEAFATRCGTAIDLVVSSADEDWFSYEAPEGTTVQLGVVASAGTIIGLEMYDAAGQTQITATTDILAGGGTISATSPGPNVLARVTTPGAAVSYRLTATCMAGNPMDPNNPMDPLDPKPDDPGAIDNPRRLSEVSGGCGCTAAEEQSGAPIMMFLAALVLVRRRPKR